MTGEKVSKVKCPLFRNDLVGGGTPRLVGGDTARPALGMLRGCDGVATSAMVDRVNWWVGGKVDKLQTLDYEEVERVER